MASISLAAAPLFGTLAGPASWPSLEDVLAPVLLYAMALDIVSESLAPVEACRPSAMLFLTALGTISAGSLVILSLYYVDALFSLNLLQTNSDLMWPLSTLFLGTIVITLVVRATGLEEHIWARKEVSG
jgi:hypothetical protein